MIKFHSCLQKFNAERSDSLKVITIQKVHVVTLQFDLLLETMFKNDKYNKLNHNDNDNAL